MTASKRLAGRTETRFGTLEHPWSELSGSTIIGYEIRHGHSTASEPAQMVLPGGLGWAHGPVLGIYLHGLFENPELVRAILGATPRRTLDQAIGPPGLPSPPVNRPPTRLTAALLGSLMPRPYRLRDVRERQERALAAQLGRREREVSRAPNEAASRPQRLIRSCRCQIGPSKRDRHRLLPG